MLHKASRKNIVDAPDGILSGVAAATRIILRLPHSTARLSVRSLQVWVDSIKLRNLWIASSRFQNLLLCRLFTKSAASSKFQVSENDAGKKKRRRIFGRETVPAEARTATAQWHPSRQASRMNS